MNDQLQAALTKLADKLGTSAEHLWGVLIRQARVEIVTDLSIFALATIAAVGMVRYWKWIRDGESDWDDNFGQFIFSILGTLAAGVFFVVGIVSLFDLPTLIFNPEYWALKEIMGALK